MNTKQLEVAIHLENLVHKRFSKKDFQKYINDYFGTSEITVNWTSWIDLEAEQDTPDFMASFSTWGIDGIEETLIGDFDVYYLELKQPNADGLDVYVTDVAYWWAYEGSSDDEK